MEKRFSNNKFLIGFAILLLGWNFLASFHVLEANISTPKNPILVLFVFSFYLGWVRYGFKNTLVFVILTFVIAWTLETTSINTGFPFGHYHYTELLGPKLGQVPYVIMPAYFSVGFLAWTLSHVLLNNLGSAIQKNNLIIGPLVAAFIMVMWDFCMDPITATIDSYWIWENGGSYFGVPLKNYAGWFFTVYLIFQFFALYLYFLHKKGKSTGSGIQLTKRYWYAAVLTYFVISLFFLSGIFDHSNPEKFAASSSIQVSFDDIKRSMGLVASMSMLFVSFITFIMVRRMNTNTSINEK
jgi:putative membrane protein